MEPIPRMLEERAKCVDAMKESIKELWIEWYFESECGPSIDQTDEYKKVIQYFDDRSKILRSSSERLLVENS
tara:strand:+ start:430 stop:645 length:216 start_codon:yes stop_codon:yes gene_type:complete